MNRNCKKESTSKQSSMVGQKESTELRKIALNLTWERIKLQQEVRDRWFRYSLIILGVPLVLLLSKNQPFFVDSSLTRAATAFLFALIGFFFFLLHVHQRINSVNLHAELQQILDPIRRELNISSENQKKNSSKNHDKKSKLHCMLSIVIFRKQSWGADFWANVVQATMNSSLLFLAYYNILDGHPWWGIILFLSTCAFQLYLRQKIVLPAEAGRRERREKMGAGLGRG